MNKDLLRKKLDTGTAYFLYCVILMVVAVIIVLAAHIYTDHEIITEIIAAFLAAIITAMITRVLLRQQTQSNLEMVEKQTQNELLNDVNSEINKDRMMYAHAYLDLIYEVIHDRKITEEEKLKLEIQFQHIVYNITMGNDANGDIMMLTEPLKEIAETTKNIIEIVLQNNQDNFELNKQLFILTKALRSIFQGKILVDSIANTDSIFKTWSQIKPCEAQ